MSKPECPVCRAPTINAGKLRYCAQCGWQKKQTEEQLRLSLKMVPIVFAVMTLVLLLLFLRSGPGTQRPGLIAFFLSFPLIALVLSYSVTRRNLKILRAQPPVAAVGAGTGRPTGGQNSALSPQYEALLKTLPPRKLRMSRRGRFNLSLTLFAWFVFAAIIFVQLYRAWATTHSFAEFRTREWGMVGLAVLLLLLLVSQWRILERERGLLIKGEVVAAKVTRKVGSRTASAIKYEFEDFNGVRYIKTGTDYTQGLDEGMWVPVFYDRENPNRQVPACGTLHAVVVQDERTREPEST